jgi:hypothetical protein
MAEWDISFVHFSPFLPQIRIQRAFKKLEETINEVFGQSHLEAEMSCVLPHSFEDLPSIHETERFHTIVEGLTVGTRDTVMGEIDKLLASFEISISPRLDDDGRRKYESLLEALETSLELGDSETAYKSVTELKYALSTMLPTIPSVIEVPRRFGSV